ncbi:MAG: hypothetical protein FWG97_03420 [Deltaproteobacteria bacterium]|nr:hypothetical protein [Deltaproteobacteria bacterium]
MSTPPVNPASAPLAANPPPAPGSARPELSAGPAGPASARPYAALALARVAEMMGDPDPKVAFPACREVLDRAWGKAQGKGAPRGALRVVVRIHEAEDDGSLS